jgi:predicted methyltransferase
MQRDNPWSRELFTQQEAGKITRRETNRQTDRQMDRWTDTLYNTTNRLLGDATELVPLLPAAGFDCAVHDPPAQAMAGELYSVPLHTL